MRFILKLNDQFIEAIILSHLNVPSIKFLARSNNNNDGANNLFNLPINKSVENFTTSTPNQKRESDKVKLSETVASSSNVTNKKLIDRGKSLRSQSREIVKNVYQSFLKQTYQTKTCKRRIAAKTAAACGVSLNSVQKIIQEWHENKPFSTPG